MTKPLLRSLQASLLLLLAGCYSNPYDQFYQAKPDQADNRLYQKFSGTTQYVSADTEQIGAAVDDYRKHGYRLLGYSSFEAGNDDYSASLKSKAKEVGADVVILSSKFAKTVSGTMPLVQFHPGQMSTTHAQGTVNASAYGRGGSAYATGNYSGTSTTTTPWSTSVNYVPYSADRYSFVAAYLRKGRYVSGIATAPLSDELRKKYQRNTGVIITGLVEGGPGFLANLLVGDIMLAIDGVAVTSTERGNEIISAKAGQLVKFEVLRDDKPLTIPVQLNPL